MESEKKTALLLVPSMDRKINRHRYLLLCIDKVLEEQCMPLTPAFYDSTSVDQDEFVDKMLPMVDVIYLFINFGIDQPMLNVIDRAVNKIELRYRRIIQDNVESIFSSPYQVLLDMCRRSNYTPEELRVKTRKREVVDARFVYCRRAREVTKATLEQIGKEVNLDHASVMHGIREANETQQVIELYNRCYAKNNKRAVDVSPEKGSKKNDGTAKIEYPVLPYRSSDPREHNIPGGRFSMQSLLGREYQVPFNGYRPHNT